MMYNLEKVSTGEGCGSRLILVRETANENEEPQPQHSVAREAGSHQPPVSPKKSLPEKTTFRKAQ
jgi:hypothetical protein